jgi:hypothetical protein
MGRRRVKPGDVLELVRENCRVYAQYLGRHPHYGDGILVRPTPLVHRPTLTGDLFTDGYVTFYPASLAVARGLAEVIGTLPSGGLPDRFRRSGAIGEGGKTLTWVIEDGRSETVRRQLAEGERELPIAEIWNHEMLFHRVSKHWRPENEG